MTALVWGPPPDPQPISHPHTHSGGRGPTSRWIGIAAQLRSRPGEWAIVHVATIRQTADDYASRISRGLLPATGPRGSFQGASRHVDGQYRVYARYLRGADA